MLRRDFIKFLSGVPVLAYCPQLVYANTKKQKTIILVELQGGNDGLNTVIPYSDPEYYKLRPNIAIPKDEVLQLSNKLGFHPALQSILPAWKGNDIAIVNGVGYENPNRSHFRSIEIWETASQSEDYATEGWLAKHLLAQTMPVDINAIVVDNDLGPLSGTDNAIIINDVEKFLQGARKLNKTSNSLNNSALQHIQKVQSSIALSAEQLALKVKSAKNIKASFPKTSFSRDLKTIASIMAAGVNVPVYKLSLGSFDTHAGQQWQHKKLLQTLGDGLAAFRSALQEQSLWDDVVVMTYSEFGRRAQENASRGTDHGTAAPHFIMGGKVKGGFYGEQPSLTNLVNGDLVYKVDFKLVYTSIVQQSWSLPTVKSSGYGKLLPFIRI